MAGWQFTIIITEKILIVLGEFATVDRPARLYWVYTYINVRIANREGAAGFRNSE